MSSGTINVQAQNIFPIIKKFLYSDHEIFLRELISNAVDATQKLNTLSSVGDFKGEIGDTTIEIKLDKDAKTITISDKGIGMTDKEVQKYINEIAFSGAEDFVKKYEDKASIIGHFGLGFYSSFMVAGKVEIISKSYKKAKAIHWQCEGKPEFDLESGSKKERGTDIVLHISEEGEEFLEENKLKELLDKYCKFMPVEIKFKDEVINNTNPAWTKTPTKLKDEDYNSFYKELYPMTFEDPLFHIHLNVDYPFNLTGILYFPKIKERLEVQKNKIQLYSNQVFVTDSVEGIVPEFLTLLHGVIDSPDIPLNVSRSYLQSDGNVKKISNHITKKVADKLEDMYKKDRKDFEEKWDDIKIFIEYGMLSEQKFWEKAKKFTLYKNINGEYATLEEIKEKAAKNQKNKDDKTVILYTHNKEEHYTYIQAAKDKGYDVLEMNTPLTAHLIARLEQEETDLTFARIDSNSIEKLIDKGEEIPNKLSEDDEKKIKPLFEEAVEKEKFMVTLESISETAPPVTITQPEFMRRMKDMNSMGGSMGNMPDMLQLNINTNHPLVGKLLAGKKKEQKELTKQLVDLALLSQNMLKGEELNKFVQRNMEALN